jgi:hypothetical protein
MWPAITWRCAVLHGARRPLSRLRPAESDGLARQPAAIRLMLVAASQASLLKHDLEERFPRMAEIPFDSERKRMTTVHQMGSARGRSLPELEPLYNLGTPRVAFTKGAVDSLLDICPRIWVGGRVEAITDEWPEHSGRQRADGPKRYAGPGHGPEAHEYSRVG